MLRRVGCKPGSSGSGVLDVTCLDGTLPMVCMKKGIPYLGLVWADLHREQLLGHLGTRLFEEYLDPEPELYKPALAEAFNDVETAVPPSGAGEPEAVTPAKKRQGANSESAAKRRRSACKAAATRKRGAAGAIAAALAAAGAGDGPGALGDGAEGEGEPEEADDTEPGDTGEEARARR